MLIVTIQRLLILICYKKNVKERNANCPEIPDHPYMLLIIRGSGYGKASVLHNRINHKPLFCCTKKY